MAGKMDVMTALPTSAPLPGALELRGWTLDGYQGLRDLRAELREAVVEVSSADLGDLADRMAVVATELATNALRHGLPPTVIRLLRVDDRFVLDCADHDVQAAPRLDPDRPPGRGGLGLLLTRTFAVDVGWYKTDRTKHVWASFPAVPPVRFTARAKKF
ncbi:hypothetical protein Acsp01_63860 [Actinoplanes sp. NBRC 101535]|nr:hypothetical protein Acsp01_63860 [Actinoplanes sp. NBRC 101535]